MDSGADSYLRYLKGDDNGIVEIIRDYKDGLILYISGFVCDIHTAEDITEDTFVKLAAKKPRFSGKSKFKTWLYTIARNSALDHIRKNSKISNKPIEDYAELPMEQADFEKQYLLAEQKLYVHSALKKLSPDYRQVLYLIYFEDFSNAEAAAIMKKSKHQLENILYRARKSLKAQLEREGFIYEEL